MHTTRALEAAIFVVLGSMVALSIALGLLVLSDLRVLEAQMATMSGLPIAMAKDARYGIGLASCEPCKTQVKQAMAPLARDCVACQPALDARPATPTDFAIQAERVRRHAEQLPISRQVTLATPENKFFGLGIVHPKPFKAPQSDDVLVVADKASLQPSSTIPNLSLGSGMGAQRSLEFRRLQQSAMLFGVASSISGLLLLVLFRSSLAAEKTAAREVACAKDRLEQNANESTVALQRTIETLRLNAAHVDAALEEERVRIARDIHDDLGSILTALKFELAGVSGGGAGDRGPLVRRASTDLVDSALQAVRSLIAALRPYPLERAGLWGAVVWKADQLEKMLGVPCRVSVPEDLPQPSLPVSLAAFRIVEEALTNVARHAHATSISIVAHFVAGHLTIEVTDDGCGLANCEAPLAAGSFGLTGMRERARVVGGSLSVMPRAAHGTTVRFSVQDPAAQVGPVFEGKVA